MWTGTHKEARKEISITLMHCYNIENEFLANFITGDETWIHFFKHRVKMNTVFMKIKSVHF